MHPPGAARADRALCSSEDTRFYSLIFFFLHMKYFQLALPLILSFTFLFEVLPPPEICPQLAEILQFMKFTFYVKFLPLFRWNFKLVTVQFSVGCLLTERGSLWRGQLPENQRQPLCAHFCQLIAIPPMPGHCWDLQASCALPKQVVFFLAVRQRGWEIFLLALAALVNSTVLAARQWECRFILV